MSGDCGHGHECTGHRLDHVKARRLNERTVTSIKQLLRGYPEGLKPEQLARQALGIKFAPREASQTLVRGLLDGHAGFEFDGARWRLAESEFTSLDLVPFIVVDVETTGGRPATNRLIELGAFTGAGGAIKSSIMALINPGRKIPLQISHLTGIYDEHVKYSPKVDEVLPRFLRFMGGGVFVGHNARFDFSFINAELARCGMPPLACEVLCTIKLTRRIFPGEPSFGLDNLIKKFGLDLDPAERHRGHGDAWATAEILIRCIGILRRAGMASLEELLAFQQMPPPAARKKWNLRETKEGG